MDTENKKRKPTEEEKEATPQQPLPIPGERISKERLQELVVDYKKLVNDSVDRDGFGEMSGGLMFEFIQVMVHYIKGTDEQVHWLALGAYVSEFKAYQELLKKERARRRSENAEEEDTPRNRTP